MKTSTSLHQLWRSSNRGAKPAICQRHTEITKRPSCFAWILLTIAALSLMPLAAIGQVDHGSHGGSGGSGGGGGCGDVFGDLIHILRNEHGQPILAQRWVELPAEVPRYGWGYCPIAVSGPDKQELPFLPYSCDIDPGSIYLVEEVDYFGRLNGGRTKERNNRMHFDEVISNIKAAHLVNTDAAGRLMLGYDCTLKNGKYKSPCLEWATIDSPMEHMGLYTRIMKYGHLATDPNEIDTWAHGDPKSGTPFHVALGPEDWPKFHNSLRHLLPNNGEDPDACWDYNDEFKIECAGAEDLQNRDFVSGAVSLASAASKTGMITTDLIQYFGRIMKTAKKTEHTVAPNNTLPALYRDCWLSDEIPVDPPELAEGEVYEEDLTPYLDLEFCLVEEADIPPKVKPDVPDYDYCDFGTPNHCLFPDLQERFVDFSGFTDYEREADNMVLIINTSATAWELPLPSPTLTLESDASDTWEVTPGQGINLVTWMEAVNGEMPDSEDLPGIDVFRWATSDFLRTIEFIHNYAVPEVLECSYGTTLCAVE